MRWSRTGTEPTSARSAYGLRRVLAGAALVWGVGALVAFVVLAWRGGPAAPGYWAVAVVSGIVAVTAFVDLMVIRRRTAGRHD